jgi:hypothetical protein
MEFAIVDNGFKVHEGRVLYQWLSLADGAGRRFFRAVAFRELTYLPIEMRDDPDMLGKQWGALRGLYNASADFVYTAMGVFRPQRLGVVQFYGAAAEAETEASAAREALRRMAAVEATLANFPQSRTEAPDLGRVDLLTERLRRLPKLLAILGHPDPRLARKGLGRDGAMGVADDELMSQQGENLLRGLARLSEDFVFLVTAAFIGRPELTAAMIKMAQVASQVASRQRGSIGAGFSIAVPLAAALSNAYAQNLGHSQSVGRSQADTVSEGWSQSESQSWGHSVGESQSHGVSHTESSTVTDTEGSSHGVTASTGWGHADSLTNTASGAHTDSVSHTDSGSHTDSVSHTDSGSHAESASHTDSGSHTESQATGVAHSEGQNWGVSDGASSGWSASAGHTDSASQAHATGSGVTASAGSATGHTDSSSTGSSQSQGVSDATSQSNTTSQSQSNTVGVSVSAGIPGVVSGSASASHGWTDGQAESLGASHAESSSTGTSQSTGAADSVSHSSGLAVSASVSDTVGSGEADSVSAGVSGGVSHSESQGGSSVTTTSESHGSADTVGWADTKGSADTVGRADTKGSADTVGWADAKGAADTRGWAISRGSADSVSGGRAVSDTVSRAHSVSSGVADSESWGESVSEGWSEGKSVGRGVSAGRSHGTGLSEAEGVSLGAGRAFSGGMSAGLMPGVSLSRHWQTEDDVAIRLTEVTRGLESLLNTASHEGGFMTTALLLATDGGERAAQALVPQAFHGPNVPTPVLTVPGAAVLRDHALAFRPSLAPDGDPFRINLLWSKWGTLLTPAMLAALTCPNLFEEGTAVTIQEKLPPLAFYPELPGEVVLGHQVSPETGDLTLAPLRLSRDAHFHTAFCGDTGYGKSVAAVRLAYETTLHWQLKTIVLDFGAGWRQLLNAPGLAGHVEIRQLSPGGVRPLRWNPLQIGRNILPEVQWRAFADIFGAIAQLGQKRQIHELREILRKVYLAAGVLVDDPECRNDPAWGQVRPAEAAAAGVAAGTPLAAMDRPTRQALAATRSREVGLADLYRRIEAELATIPPKDIRRAILEGINFRLEPLVQGEAGLQYRAGEGAIDINDIVPGEWGVAVLEGGAFLDDFSKAFLLGWAAWQLYTDAVVLRTRRSASQPAHLQIFFEEANKMLAGLDNGGSRDDEGSGLSTADQFANMWRDSRKYGIWLHLVTQSPSLIPPGIMSSCNNLFSAQLKNARDRDAVIAAFARSEKGFVDEPWRRFLASIPVARMVVKLGYQADRARLEPTYIEPLLLEAPEPSDEEIVAALGAIAL